MAIDRKLVKLGIQVAKNEARGNFSIDEMSDAFRKEVAKLVSNDKGEIDYYNWKEKSPLVMALLSEVLTAIEPKKVREDLGVFANIKTIGHNDQPRIVTPKGKQNVKRFVTKVAAAGRYERVRLDSDYFDIDVYAHGGAVYQTLEGFLAGRENITDVFNILLDGLQDEMYADIVTALKGIQSDLPDANKHTAASFSDTNFKRILATVRAYGIPNILCPYEFASTITGSSDFIADQDKQDMRELGYLGKYAGANVVLLPQSFEDETNETKVVDPMYAYIIPSGSNNVPPINVVMQGDTLVRNVEREDWSTEIQVYRKMGVGVMHTNHIGIYKNTALT